MSDLFFMGILKKCALDELKKKQSNIEREKSKFISQLPAQQAVPIDQLRKFDSQGSAVKDALRNLSQFVQLPDGRFPCPACFASGKTTALSDDMFSEDNNPIRVCSVCGFDHRNV